MYYPDEAERAKAIDSTQRTDRLRFVHVSDTHPGNTSNNPLAYADEFTELSSADFLTLTGDMVNNTIVNDFTSTIGKILAMEKPCYICIGNHDIWNDTTPTQRYDKYFNPIAEHNGVPENISYYSKDFATQKIKCIWLDIYELSTGTPSHQLSATQIEWFFSELDNAITNNYHVCVFFHDHFAPLGKVVDDFMDTQDVTSMPTALAWIPETIRAYQNAGTVSFEHNGGSYTHTFSGNGVFVSYFTGHAHRDRAGWLRDYPEQFLVTVARAWEAGESGVVNDKLKCNFNYVAIDTNWRRLSIVRLGNSRTIFGTERTAFSILY